MSITRNQIALTITAMSFLFLYPGVTEPMITIKMHGQIDSSLANMGMNILNKSRSILQTVSDLYKSKDTLVANLILFFSVIIPVLKGILLLTTAVIKNSVTKKKIITFVKTIGKWSMADVFVVAIFIAFLSTQSQPAQSIKEVQIMGFNVKFAVNIALNSSLGSGFYFFLAYCLSSLCALQIFSSEET